MIRFLLLLLCCNLSCNSFSQDDPIENSDSVSWFYYSGELRKVSYIKETYKKKVAAHLPIQIEFDRHGHKLSAVYHTITGKVTIIGEEEIPREDLNEPYRSWLLDKNYIRASTLKYDTINPDCPLSGSTEYSHYTIENCQLIRRTTDSYFRGGYYENPEWRYPYCIEEGTFDNFILHNGTIRYYSINKEIVTTVQIKNGRRINDGPVPFKDDSLLADILDLQPIDLNFNGEIEVSESSVYTMIRVPKTISSVADLRKFKQLKFIVSEDELFEIANFPSDQQLLTAIQNAKSNNSRDPNRLAAIQYGPSTATADIKEYPTIEASFPGGKDSLLLWIKTHQTYPEKSLQLEDEGNVWLTFIVEPDGSITNIQIEKSVSKELDQAAKELVASMPPWNPKETGGKKVRAKINLPITYVFPKD